MPTRWEQRLLAEVKLLRETIMSIPDYGEALPASTTPLILEYEAFLNSRGACGMRYHHRDCDCGGEGGDR